jgi:hypothetical protein
MHGPKETRLRQAAVAVCRLGLLVVLICLPLVVLAQSQFSGKWQTKTSRVTGKPTITVNITESENKLTGTVVLVNPDRSEMEIPILSPELKGETLEFETKLQGAPFDWRLTLKGSREALLHGSDRRPSKGGQGGEMVIDEHVVKQGDGAAQVSPTTETVDPKTGNLHLTIPIRASTKKQ